MEELKDSLTLIKQDLVTKKIVSVENTSKESIEKLASKQENLLTDCDLDSILWTGNFELATLQKLTSSGHLSFPSLLPVVTLDLEQKVLMQAFVNTTALSETFRTGFANYFSRSRNKIWLKGESSDNRQEIVDVYNSVGNSFFIYVVKQKIAACHEGFYSCFYRKLNQDQSLTQIDFDRKFKPEKVYG